MEFTCGTCAIYREKERNANISFGKHVWFPFTVRIQMSHESPSQQIFLGLKLVHEEILLNTSIGLSVCLSVCVSLTVCAVGVV